MRLALLTLVAVAGCYDTQDELDKFIERTEDKRIIPSAVECTSAFDVSGRYVFGVATSLDPTKPLRFDATYEVDDSTTPWTLTITAQAMAVEDGALVGDVHTKSGAIGSNGIFNIDFGEILVPGPANPIQPIAVRAILQLEGCTRAADFACGIVHGEITSIHASLEGSTWGLTPVPDDGDPATLTPVNQCPE